MRNYLDGLITALLLQDDEFSLEEWCEQHGVDDITLPDEPGETRICFEVKGELHYCRAVAAESDL